MTLSCYIICRDSAGSLPATVQSVRGIVDQLVIGVDDASTDNTLEVAKRVGADEVYEFTWPDSFAAARNIALEKCTGDWIISMDADETVPADVAPLIRPLLERLPESVSLLMCRMMMFDKGLLQQQFLGEKIYRGTARYHGEMHNWVDVPEEGRLCTPEIEIHHSRDLLSDEWRGFRNKQRLEMAERHLKARADSDPNDRRSCFYLAGTYRDCGKYEEAVEYFSRYLERSDWKEERYQARLLMGQSLYKLNRVQEAREMLTCCEAENWRRAEHLMLLGEIAVLNGEFEAAKMYFMRASQMEVPLDPFFIEVSDYTWLPRFRLAEVAFNTMDAEGMERELAAAREMGMPPDAAANLNRDPMRVKPKPITKMGYLVDRGQRDFIDPLWRGWTERYEQRLGTEEGDIEALEEWADALWFEWAGPLCAAATRRPKKTRTIVRVHGYELHDGSLERVNWSNVDEVIFTAAYQYHLAVASNPSMDRCRCLVAHAGCDARPFIIGADKDHNKVAMACHLNYKKNLPLALQVFAKALKRRPTLTLHIAGDWQDSRVRLYTEKMLDELRIRESVFFDGYQRDLNRWYADKSYFLSTSLEESLQVACAEAMAAGLKPVIHVWESAEDVYPARYLFRTVDEGAEMLCDPPQDPMIYRTWALERLDIAVVRERIDRFLAAQRVAIPSRDAEEHRIEGRLSAAMMENGVMPGVAYNADFILLCDPALLQTMPDLSRPGPQRVFWNAEIIWGETEHAADKRKGMEAAVKWADVLVSSTPQGEAVMREMAPGKPCFSIYLGGAHGGLIPEERERDIDIGFVGLINTRRQEILTQFEAAGLPVTVLQSYKYKEVCSFLSRCKIVVNPHYTDDPNCETRVAEALAMGCALVSEPLASGHPFIGAPIAEGKNMVELAEDLLASGRWRTAGEQGKRYIWQNVRLDSQVQQLLRLIGR